MQNKTLTILFADVQGYTSRTGSQGRDENAVFVREIRDFVERHVRDNNGTFVKAMGDGFLATFESPTDAVSAGTRIQRQIEQRNANTLNESNLIRFRIGVSTGEVTVDETGDVFGDAVNIAARIQSFAEPNEVFISDATYLSMNKTEIKAMDLGPQRFKNVLQEVRVYRVLKGVEAARSQPLPRPTSYHEPARSSFPIGYIALGTVALALIALTMFLFGRLNATNNAPAMGGYPPPPPPGYGGQGRPGQAGGMGGPPPMPGQGGMPPGPGAMPGGGPAGQRGPAGQGMPGAPPGPMGGPGGGMQGQPGPGGPGGGAAPGPR